VGFAQPFTRLNKPIENKVKLVKQIQGISQLGEQMLALSCLSAVATTAGSSSIFDDSNDSGWTGYSLFTPFGANATLSFPNGAYRMQTPALPQPNTLGPGREGSDRQDVEIADFYTSNNSVDRDHSLEQGFWLLAQMQEFALGTTDGYWMHYITDSPAYPGQGSLVLDRLDNEFSIILDVVPITPHPDQDYRLVFAGVGSVLTGQLFSIADFSIPLTTGSLIDSTHISGEVGLLVQRCACPATISAVCRCRNRAEQSSASLAGCRSRSGNG
jgi:hypothetical protein